MEIMGDSVKGGINEASIASPMLDQTASSDGNLQASVHYPSQFSPQSSALAQIIGDGNDCPFNAFSTSSFSATGSPASPTTPSTRGNLSASINSGSGSGNLVMRNVYISGLPPHFLPKDFRKMCQAFGPIEASKLSIDDTTRPTKGYGFALFYTPESALACIESLNGRDLCGRTLQARFSHAAATPKEPSTRSTPLARPQSNEPTRMNATHRPVRQPSTTAPSSIATTESVPSPRMPPWTEVSATPMMYPAPQPLGPSAWPLSVAAPAAPYPQVVLINGQYYTLPATTVPAMPYYQVLSTPMTSAATTGELGRAPAPAPAPAPGNMAVGVNSVPPLPYAAVPASAIQLPGYYFLPS